MPKKSFLFVITFLSLFQLYIKKWPSKDITIELTLLISHRYATAKKDFNSDTSAFCFVSQPFLTFTFITEYATSYVFLYFCARYEYLQLIY